MLFNIEQLYGEEGILRDKRYSMKKKVTIDVKS